MRKVLASVAAGIGAMVCALTVTAANAATVTFSNITGAWSNVVVLDDAGSVSTVGNGTNVATLAWGEVAPADPQSSYVFDGASDFMLDVPPTVQAILGDFTHNNNPIADPGEELVSATLSVVMDIVIDAVNLGSFSFDFDFSHNETSNTGGGCCNDIITITNLSELSQNFLVNGFIYTITVLGFQIGGDEFSTVEGMANTANLLVEVSVQAIPVPGALALFVSGLAGLFVAYRRRRAVV
ncbi:MAG: THxN family PEP-CTERM protein [Parvularculaceae bacterium]